MKAFLGIRFREKKVRQAAVLTPEDVRTLLNSPTGAPRERLRDRAILALLFGCGLRCSEVQAIDLGDVRVSSRGVPYLRLATQKSGKAGVQPMPPWVVELVAELVAERYRSGATNLEPLFIRYTKKRPRIGTRFVNNLVVRLARRCGLREVTSHSGRATAITHLLAEGHGPRQVMTFSRHASLAAMERYDRQVSRIKENIGLLLRYGNDEKNQ